MEGVFNCRNNCAFIILRKSWFVAITPQQTKVLTEKKPANYILVSMVENEEREIEIIDEVDDL